MPRRDTPHTQRHRTIARMLSDGFSVEQVAKQLDLSRRCVADVAKAHRLPTNPMVFPNSRTENQICRALVATNLNVPLVGFLFRQAPCNVQRIIDRVASSFDSRNPPKLQGRPPNTPVDGERGPDYAWVSEDFPHTPPAYQRP